MAKKKPKVEILPNPQQCFLCYGGADERHLVVVYGYDQEAASESLGEIIGGDPDTYKMLPLPKVSQDVTVPIGMHRE